MPGLLDLLRRAAPGEAPVDPLAGSVMSPGYIPETDKRQLALGLLALLIVGGGGALIWRLLGDANTTGEQRGMLIGAVVALMGSVVAFFFGSSVSSRSKDNALVRELGQR